MYQDKPELQALIDLLAVTDFTDYTVVRHGYRKVRVVGDHVTDGPFEYVSGDQFDFLQSRLAEAAASHVDNHECYEVTYPDGQRHCLWFHDWKVAVGTDVRPY